MSRVNYNEISIQLEQGMPSKKNLDKWASRRRRVVRMREIWGWKYQRIADNLGVTRERARQLYRAGAEEAAAKARAIMLETGK